MWSPRLGEIMGTTKAAHATLPLLAFVLRNYKNFNARATRDALLAYWEHIERGGRMFWAVAGAMSSAQLGITLAPAIRAGLIHGMSVTGANLEESLFRLVAHDGYRDFPDYRYFSKQDDTRILENRMRRVTDTSIGTGFGLGLFGALSIIRLRSSELGHEEVAYYFAALALGLLGGIEVDPAWVAVALPAAIIAVMFVGDHQRLFRDHRLQVVNLDRAIADEQQLTLHLERLLGARVERLMLRKLDMVNDTTTVEVRYRLADPRPSVTPLDDVTCAGAQP